jgi:hypothetical protein
MLFWQQFNLTNLHVALCLTSSNTEHCIVEAKVVAALQNRCFLHHSCAPAAAAKPTQ